MCSFLFFFCCFCCCCFFFAFSSRWISQILIIIFAMNFVPHRVAKSKLLSNMIAQGLFPDQDHPLEAQLTLVRPSRVARASHLSRRLALPFPAARRLV